VRNPDRFRGSPAGKVVEVTNEGIGPSPYHASVPSPLPPRLAITTRLARALSSADRAIGELSGLGRLLPNPYLLAHPFIRREAVSSSRIEGTQADVGDVFAYEAGLFPSKIGVGSSDVREVHNYVRALEHGVKTVKELPVCVRLMRDLHRILMEGVRGQDLGPGELRSRQNWIGRPSCTVYEADYTPPPPTEMNACLRDLERFINEGDDLPPLLRVGLVHAQFEEIHPFLDGNGRIGRLLISLLMIDWRLLPSPLLYLSDYFERNRDAYYSLLLAVSERGAWDEWLEFFLEGVATQARAAVVRAKRLEDLRAGFRDALQGVRGSVSGPRLADSLFETPFVTVRAAAKLLDASDQTARLAVERLVDVGILTPGARTRQGVLYVCQSVLAAISDAER